MQIQTIESKIHEIRGQKVMLDFDLAVLYDTETKRLKEAVRRNIHRFPPDFMFELTREEFFNLRTQFASSRFESMGWGGPRVAPFAFTEQGVAMLSSVLKSDKAIDVNISIIRAFVYIRSYAMQHKDLTEQLKSLETKFNRQFKDVYEAINYLMVKDQQELDQNNRPPIGFKAD